MWFYNHKINTQKSLAFQYTNNEKSKREIKETIPFTIATIRTKYLQIYLFKETKELYTDNCKALMKDNRDDIDRWKDIPCSCFGRINIVKITLLKNAIYRFNTIPNLPMVFFIELDKKISQFVWKHKAILREKNGAGVINLPDFRLYYKSKIIKTVWYWYKIRNIDQWNNMQSLEINHTPMGILFLTMKAKYTLEKRQSLQ